MRVKIKNNTKQKVGNHYNPTVLILLLILLWILLINWNIVWYIKIIIYICLIFSPFVLAFIFIAFSLYYKEFKKYFDYSFFHKVSGSKIALNYIWSNNFLNHHNYYKNHELEHKYFHYLKVSEIKKMYPFFFIFIIWITITLLFLNMFLVIFFIPIFALFIVMLLLYGEQKPEDIKNELNQKIYFRKIKPNNFQQIDSNIFFY